jgi:hypothetical protein
MDGCATILLEREYREESQFPTPFGLFLGLGLCAADERKNSTF